MASVTTANTRSRKKKRRRNRGSRKCSVSRANERETPRNGPRNEILKFERRALTVDRDDDSAETAESEVHLISLPRGMRVMVDAEASVDEAGNKHNL